MGIGANPLAGQGGWKAAARGGGGWGEEKRSGRAEQRDHAAGTGILDGWRRGGDSNSRYPSRYARFRGGCDRPLCHLSETIIISFDPGLNGRRFETVIVDRKRTRLKS